MEWLNEPPAWQQNGDVLTVTAGPRTDFWRKTHDGGVRDSGHFYHRTINATAGISTIARSTGTSPPKSRSAAPTARSTIRPA